ncbi:YceI family protein [Nocardioides limicola]|uniref:YceI family protein n=1 Tax=Nocardioides limicola TaxID=2803368 RepID=UPI00193AE26A|nr:YceI family protein [Nocardioides sp. DJM-14]
MTRNKVLGIVGTLVALLLAVVVVGPWAYGTWVVGEQPDELQLTSPTTAPAGPEDGSEADRDASLDGTWQVGADSVAGYRVDEVLFGRNVTVVGRTDQVIGSATVTDGVLTGTQVQVEMAAVATDEERRDAQYRTRIMDTANHPTATFAQTADVRLPATADTFTVEVPGELTVRGVTRAVTVILDVQVVDDQLEVAGAIDVTFADHGIPEAGIAGISVEDHGVIEFLLRLQR